MPGLMDNRYVNVLLLNGDLGQPICCVTTDDDWELSFTGEDAEYKFMLILEEQELTVNFLLKNGFSQYG